MLWAELHLARCVAKWRELPMSIEARKRPLGQAQVHVVGPALGVFGTELRLDAVIVDMNGGRSDGVRAQMHLGPATPGQKLRIVLATVDERDSTACGRARLSCMASATRR